MMFSSFLLSTFSLIEQRMWHMWYHMHMFQIHYFFFGCAINACFKDQPTLEICSTSNLLSESLRHASSISFSASWQKWLKTNKYFYEFAGSTNCEDKNQVRLFCTRLLPETVWLTAVLKLTETWGGGTLIWWSHAAVLWQARKEEGGNRAQSPKNAPLPAQRIPDWLPGSFYETSHFLYSPAVVF